MFPTTSEDALEVYKSLRESLLQSGLQQRRSIPAWAQQLGSAPLQQVPSSLLPLFNPSAAGVCVCVDEAHQLLSNPYLLRLPHSCCWRRSSTPEP